MPSLVTAVENTKKGEDASNAREGALMAFECLCDSLGRLFEPYLHGILPSSSTPSPTAPAPCATRRSPPRSASRRACRRWA